MKISGETLLFAPDVESPEDACIKRGIQNGLRAKGWQGEALSEIDKQVADKVKLPEGSELRPGLSLTRLQAGAALAALQRNQTVQVRYDCVGDEDRLAWLAIPELQAFLGRGSQVAND